MKICYCTLPYTNGKACENCSNNTDNLGESTKLQVVPSITDEELKELRDFLETSINKDND